MRPLPMGALWREMTDGIAGMARNLRVYLLGRGIVTTLAVAAGAVSSGAFSAAATASLTPLLPVVLLGGVVLSGVIRLRDMRFQQDRMADIYRDEIADQLGIDPEQVTRAHVHTLAYGDTGKGIPPNPVLREEIDREWNKTWLKFATSTLAAMVGYGLVQWGLASDLARSLPVAMGAAGSLAHTLGSWLSVASVGIVTGAAGLVLNNGLDIAVQNATHLGDTTLHDRIARMTRDVQKQRPVTKEQVFALFVAADPALNQRVSARYGKPYDALSLSQKSQLLTQTGAAGQMQGIADDVNARRISAGAIAFMVTGQRGIEPQQPAPRPFAGPATQQPAPIQERPRFTERVSAGERGNQGLSHTEREDLRRTSALLDGAVGISNQ